MQTACGSRARRCLARPESEAASERALDWNCPDCCWRHSFEANIKFNIPGLDRKFHPVFRTKSETGPETGTARNAAGTRFPKQFFKLENSISNLRFRDKQSKNSCAFFVLVLVLKNCNLGTKKKHKNFRKVAQFRAQTSTRKSTKLQTRKKAQEFPKSSTIPSTNKHKKKHKTSN